jgi:hypothetical protein
MSAPFLSAAPRDDGGNWLSQAFNAVGGTVLGAGANVLNSASQAFAQAAPAWINKQLGLGPATAAPSPEPTFWAYPSPIPLSANTAGGGPAPTAQQAGFWDVQVGGGVLVAGVGLVLLAVVLSRS